ncbi:uncharacterized protein LOC103523443 [Trichonephila clavipes]|nr:uncharacterized protein LOC103523443 [Trichonephila clavipes]
MKVKTKLILGEGSDDFQRPLVLPNHPIVRLYIEHVHKTMMHSGVQTTLNRIREHYWVPRGRRIVRELCYGGTPNSGECRHTSNKSVKDRILYYNNVHSDFYRLPWPYFSEDKARPHAARVAMNSLAACQTLPWPARSLFHTACLGYGGKMIASIRDC